MKTKINLILMLFLLSSCSYFRVIPKSSFQGHDIEQFENDGKFLVLHSGDDACNIFHVQVDDEILKAKPDPQLGYIVHYLDPKTEGLNKFNKKETDVINSIHLFTADTNFSIMDSVIAIPLSSIYEVRSYEYAKAPSRASRIVPAVLIPVAGISILVLMGLNQVGNGMSVGSGLSGPL